MPGSSQFLPMATSPTANVDTQAEYANSGYQQNGFTSGLAKSSQVNKGLRQGTFVAAAVAQFMANVLGIAINDDANLTEFVANLTAAIEAAAGQAVTPTQEVIAFAASMNFPSVQAPVVSYATTLTGNVTSSGFTGTPPKGQKLIFIIHQDGVGSRTFVWPGTVPGANIDGTAGATSIQEFVVDDAGVIRPTGGMTVS